MSSANLEKALAAIARGAMVVMVDDDGGAHLVGDGARTSARDVVTMLRDGGIFFVAISESRRIELGLDAQERAGDPVVRRMAVAVDAVEGVTTGISAEERARTARTVADPTTRSGDLVVPGHVPPLLAADEGVLANRGVAEAAVDLIRMAGGSSVASVCAMLDGSGRVRDEPSARSLAAERGLEVVTITDLATRRIASERPAQIVDRERIIGRYGSFTAVRLLYGPRDETHLALVRGAVQGAEEVHVTADMARPGEDLLAGLSWGTDRGASASVKRLVRSETGIFVHLHHRDGFFGPASYDILVAVLLELGPASVIVSADLRAHLLGRGVPVVDGITGPTSTLEARVSCRL
jgi:3,4-dihydroxy 2-butanone 4-phosphate synthase/GTP cyclohydrolase II